MLPEVASLDAALAAAGETIALRRVYGTAPNTINVDLPGVPAAVRSYQPVELVGGISATDIRIIISPTRIAEAQWPGGELPSATVADPSLPHKNDKAIVAGRLRNIEVVDPIYVRGELARIEMRAS